MPVDHSIGESPTGIAVVADDLTGAADTGIHFVPAGGEALLLDLTREVPAHSLIGASCLALNTASRSLHRDTVVDRMQRAVELLLSISAPLIYKKVDSQLRGLPGLETEVLRNRLGFQCALIAPAYPNQGRITQGGVHRVHGVPVAQSEAGRDPATPVSVSCLPELIADQTGVKTGHVFLQRLESGLESVCIAIEKLLDDGVQAITFDATTQEHLDLIAKAGLGRFKGALLAGSAGLALSVAKILRRGNNQVSSALPLGNALLFICGSASHTLHRQADLLVANEFCREVTITSGSLSAAENWHELETTALAAWQHGNLLVKLSEQPISTNDIGAAGILTKLTGLVLKLIKQKKPDGLFLSGGDTAREVLRGAEAAAVRLKAQVMPGMIWGFVVHGALDGVTLVTKAGSFGEKADLLELYQMWKKDCSENG